MTSDSRGSNGWPVAERSAIASVLGIPPLAAIGIAVVLTALGTFVDVLRIGTLGVVFGIAYLVGCLLAVGWVRRRNLFGPVVQPPLLVVVLVPLIVVLVGKPGPGLTETVLLVGAPLVNGFPLMAAATGLTLLVGLLRMILQRTGPHDAVSRLGRIGVRGEDDLDEDEPEDEPPVSGRRGSGAARGAGRTSTSPRRS
ncbi:DUF6542 domain-containing protein [Pseudonocardia ailaonensis]|uniref:DUF6542 domain-containing protein n=1 Tax=Pseudonocardia ailaonensis TaxID=367279 RepID=UPI0031D9C282